MKLCAIICEFNPFTNGHAYLIDQAKKQTGLDILCLMSGNFVQRGETAILNKEERATCAINAGASICVELPICYALSSAQNFAEGAIKCLNDMETVSHLAFGVESKSEILIKIAQLKTNEPKTMQTKLKEYFNKGYNYNDAMQKVIVSELPELKDEIESVFLSSNNILAIEYLTALYKTKSNIKPIFIQRTDNGYNSLIGKKIKIDGKAINFASASYIRKCINENKDYRKFVPSYSNEFLQKINKENLAIKNAKLEAIIINELQKHTKESLINFQDYTMPIASLISTNSKNEATIKNIISSSSSRAIRASRIQKLLFYPYLNITKELYNEIYNRVLPLNIIAVDKEKRNFLTKLIKESKCKMISSLKAYNELSEDEQKIIKLNQRATNLFNIITSQKRNTDLTIFV